MPAAPSAGGQTSSGEASWPLDQTDGVEACGLLLAMLRGLTQGQAKSHYF